jgi:hypothetical protein
VADRRGIRAGRCVTRVLFGSSTDARVSLNSRQQGGHRHSTMGSPSFDLLRLSRQPNCALMSV